MGEAIRPHGLLRLQPTIQHYAWGDPDFIPRLLRRSNPDGRPFAELWMGAHPEAPSRVQLSGTSMALTELIEQAPQEIIHPANVRRFRGQLPYLFKVLAAAQPLSLQLHPSQSRAEAGYVRENRAGVPLNAPHRNYKDARHKPELIVALTEFHALCGFRPLAEIAEQMAIVPELWALRAELPPQGDALKTFFHWLMTRPQAWADEILNRLVQRLTREHEQRPFRESDREYWLLRSDQVYSTAAHRDRGLFSFYLLNLVPLKPGQGMFLASGVLHAYLKGAGMEIMANSNNVLRGGLTAKHIDVPELLENLNYQAGAPEVINARPGSSGGEWIYPTPAEEFELRRLEVTETQPHATGPEHCADILLVQSLDAAETVAVEILGVRQECGQGQVFLVPRGTPYWIRTRGRAILYKATVPMPSRAPLDSPPRRLATGVGRATASTAVADRIRKNIALTQALLAGGETPELIGTVSGSGAAQSFWQGILDRSRASFQARAALSFHEDLPTNQALGLLLLWQRLKEHRRDDRGALVAFVFGDGTRSTPFTETDNAQKPAMATFVSEGRGRSSRFLSMVELALRFFVPVQQYLRRSGFNGLVVKWGDEVQIPAVDLSGADPRFREADVVRFVSLREMDADGAQNKDWVGVDERGNLTAFIARRPLARMEELASQGLVQRRGGRLYGGVNLGSIALSYALLEGLWEEFQEEVNDPKANRQDRPALDPEFFTALTIAARTTPEARAEAWARACQDSPEIERLHRHFPRLLDRLRRVIESLEQRQQRKFKMVALDFADQYWGDIGQHTKIYEFYMALNHPGSEGDIARAIAQLPEDRDPNGNRLVNTQLAPAVTVRNSVLINATLTGTGLVENSVLIGTRAKQIYARDAFDVLSTVEDLILDPRSGTYKVVTGAPVHAQPGERLTTLFLPTLGPRQFVVHESTDLRDKDRTYAVPILGNPLSFKQAHQEMGRLSVTALEQMRRSEENQLLARMNVMA